jgi:hypothetical protein
VIAQLIRRHFVGSILLSGTVGAGKSTVATTNSHSHTAAEPSHLSMAAPVPDRVLALLHPSQPPGQSPPSASPADSHPRTGAEDYCRHASPEDNDARTTPEGHPPPVKVAPPDFIPKDREYNRYLARTWDEEFEALVKKRQQFPPS